MYECLDKDKERCTEPIPEEILIKFTNSVGKEVLKCPYCRGKVKEIA